MIGSVNKTWCGLLRMLLTDGEVVRVRDQTTRELISHSSQVEMSRAVITAPSRKLGYRFLPAEAAWILSGDNRLSTIRPYSKTVSQHSDDGYSFFGGYGPKFVEQLSYVVDALYRDQYSRQAVMSLWRERPRDTKDIPCTTTLQWLIRPNPLVQGDFALNCVTTMRSSDAWLGWPYDVHTFSMMSAMVALLYRNRYRALDKGLINSVAENLDLGTLYLTAGSQHLYKRDWEMAEVASQDSGEAFAYAPFDLTAFETPEALVGHLWDLAEFNQNPLMKPLRSPYLNELPHVST